MSNHSTTQESPALPKGNAWKGFNNEQDLIQSYIDLLNNRLELSDFMRGFNNKGCIAFLIIQDSTICDCDNVEAAVSWLSDENNMNIAIEWMKSEWREMGDFSSEEAAVISMENYIRNSNYLEKFNGTCNEFDASLIKQYSRGYMRYSIDWANQEWPGATYKLNYICLDGLYWWVLCNESI